MTSQAINRKPDLDCYSNPFELAALESETCILNIVAHWKVLNNCFSVDDIEAAHYQVTYLVGYLDGIIEGYSKDSDQADDCNFLLSLLRFL